MQSYRVLHGLVLHVRLSVLAGMPRCPPPGFSARVTGGAPAGAPAGLGNSNNFGRFFFRKLLLLSVSGECASMVVPARMSCFCATRDRANGLPSRVESRPRPPLLTAKFIKDK